MWLSYYCGLCSIDDARTFAESPSRMGVALSKAVDCHQDEVQKKFLDVRQSWPTPVEGNGQI